MRHPPFARGGQKAPSKDYCNERGAHILAGMIRAAWKKVGIAMETEVVQVMRGKDGTPIFTVRLPELLNGLPVRRP